MNKSLLKDSVIYSIGSFCIKAFAFFLIPIYTRFLTVEEYGTLALLMMMLQLVSFIFLFGVSSAAMRYYFNPNIDEIQRKVLYGNALILLLTLPVIIIIFIGPTLYYLASHFLHSVPFYPYVFVIIIIGLFVPIQKLLLGMLRVKKMVKSFVFYTISFFLIQTFSIIVSVVFLGFGLKGVIYAQLFTNFLFWAIALIIIKKNSICVPQKPVIRKILLFGIPLIPFFVFTWISTASSRFMLERFSSLQDVGIFALAAQFSAMLLFLSNALDNAVLPYFYETAQANDARAALGEFSTKYFAFFGFLSLLTLAIAPVLIKIMADQRFHGAIIFVPLLILAEWLNINYKIFYWSLMHTKQTGLISILTSATAILMVGLLFLALVIWKLSIYGVVYAVVAVSGIKLFAGYFVSQRFYKIKFMLKEISLIAIVLTISALVIMTIPSHVENLILNSSLKACILIVSLFSLLKIAKLNTLFKFASYRAE